MAFIFVVMPTIGWAWPALAPIVGAVAAGLGFEQLSDPHGIFRGKLTRRMEKIRRETVAMDEVLTEVIADEVQREERLMFKRDDIILIFRKDARGKFFVEVSGPAKASAHDLKIRAEEFARELVRKFAYNRIAEQLLRKNAEIYNEQQNKDGRITLSVRQWH